MYKQTNICYWFRRVISIVSPKRRARLIPKSVMRSMSFMRLLNFIHPTGKTKIILKLFPSFVVNDMVEILFNIIYKNVRIDHSHVMKLKTYKKPLLKLLSMGKGKPRTHFLHNQSSGFFNVVLQSIVSTLGHVN